MFNIDIFKTLSDLYKQHGYKLYMVGGTSRDYLLKREFDDFDLCSDATPDEEKAFLDNVDDSFAKYGTIKINYLNTRFEITTLRKEAKYSDNRHPEMIEFVKDIETDYKRRDFTINALYIDDSLNIYDFGSGKQDLNTNLIRMIGDPNKRLREDPLRILRAIRFSLVLDFDIEERLLITMKKLSYLISSLNPEKVKQEIKKALALGIDKRTLRAEFKKINLIINDLENM